MALPRTRSDREYQKFEENAAGEVAIRVIGTDDGGSVAANIEGNVAHDAVDSGNPVKVGGSAQDPTSLPTAVAADDRTDAYFDLSGRQIVTQGTLLGESDTPTALLGASATVTGLSTLFDSDGDNTAQALKASAGNLYKIDAINGGASLNAAVSYIQFFDAATGSVTVGTTTPKYVIPVPASGFSTIDLPVPMTFDTAITYACTTAPTTNGDPTNGLTLSFGYK